MSDIALSASALEYRHGNRVTLRDITLSVSAGEVVGVVGPNGAGKTTLLRVFAGLTPPARGSLTWLGATRLVSELRRRIGYLPDQAALFDELSGLENLQLFAGVRRAGVNRTALQALAVSLGLTEEQLGARAATYSFGMRRKLALAQTIAGEPRLLLLDEPTLGLDAGARELLGAVLRGRAGPAAILLASNDLPFVQDYCDRVLFLAGGSVVLEGKPATLLEPLQGMAGFRVALRAAYRPIQVTNLEEHRIDERTLTFHSGRGTAQLALLVDALLSAGNDIENIGVRHADLSDVFRRVTGSEWEQQ